MKLTIKRSAIVFAVILSGFYAETAVASQESQLLVAKGLALLEKGDSQGAIGLLEEAVKEDAEDEDAYYYLGQSYNLAGKFDEALRSLENVDRSLWDVSFDKGFAQYQLGDYAAAVSSMNAVIADDPDRSDARFYLGVSLYRLGQAKDAVRELKGIKTIDPVLMPYAKLYLAMAYRTIGEIEKSTQMLKSLQKKHPESKAAEVAKEISTGVSESGGETKAKGKPRLFSMNVGIAQQYDSNPALTQKDVAIAEQFGAPGLATDAGAMRTQVQGRMGLNFGSEKWKMSFGPTFFQSFHELNSSASDYNVFSGGGFINVLIKRKTWDVSTSVRYVRTLLGPWDPYSQSIGGTLAGGTNFGANRAGAGLEISSEKFDTEGARNGLLVALPLHYMRLLHKDTKLIATAGLRPLLFVASDDASEYGYKGLGLSLRADIRPIKQFSAGLGFGWNLRGYNNEVLLPPENNLSSRTDNEINLGARLGVHLGIFSISGSFTYVNNSSVALYSYSRHVSGIDFALHF